MSSSSRSGTTSSTSGSSSTTSGPSSSPSRSRSPSPRQRSPPRSSQRTPTRALKSQPGSKGHAGDRRDSPRKRDEGGRVRSDEGGHGRRERSPEHTAARDDVDDRDGRKRPEGDRDDGGLKRTAKGDDSGEGRGQEAGGHRDRDGRRPRAAHQDEREREHRHNRDDRNDRDLGSSREAHRDAREREQKGGRDDRDDRRFKEARHDEREREHRHNRGDRDDRRSRDAHDDDREREHRHSREDRDTRRQHTDGRSDRVDRNGRQDGREQRAHRGERTDRGGHRSPSPRERWAGGGDARHGSPGADRKRRRSSSPDERHDRWQDRRAFQRSPSPSPRGTASCFAPAGRGRDAARENLSPHPPDVGSILPGVVQAVKPFGVFVQLEGYQRHCLVHHSQVSRDIQLSKSDEDDMKVKALEYAAPAGAKVWVKVTEVTGDAGSFKVHGSMKSVSQEDGTDLDPTGRMVQNQAAWTDEPPEEGSVHRGTVKRIEPYGVFVQLDGFKRFGLVHTSQVSNFLEFSREDSDEEKVAALSGVLAVNDPVWVKVVEVQEGEGGRGPRIGCSIKLVNQTDGTDLDPHGLRYKPLDAGGGGGPMGRGAPIGADAGAVGKSGVINWGYTKASDARVAAGGKGGYNLLDDEVEGGAKGGGGGREGEGGVMAPAGRGRGNVLPAWMTGAGQGGMVPGQELPPPPPLPSTINSVDEALAILQKYGAGKKAKKEKKKSKKSKEKHKKEKSGKEKKSKKKHKKEKKG